MVFLERRAYFFFGGSRPVMVPSAISAAKQIGSDKVGVGVEGEADNLPIMLVLSTHSNSAKEDSRS